MVPQLSTSACRDRQAKLTKTLAAERLDAALVCDRRHVYYLTGYWCRSIYAPLLLLKADGAARLSIPAAQPGEIAADAIEVYRSNAIGTLMEDQLAAALGPLESALHGTTRIGCDAAAPLALFETAHIEPAGCRDLGPALRRMRRKKDVDEIAVIRFAVAATEAAYRAAKENLRRGVSEVQLFARMRAAAVEFVGEEIGEFGNDFQIGSPGGPPRRHEADLGEIAVFDLSVAVRGYTSDMCRSYVVGGCPTDEQAAAHARLCEVLAEVEKACQPGARCRDVYQLAAEKLDGYRGWKFKHHLGHGIGLSPHEAPRFNPHWDESLEAGDVFTLEPGLYDPSLRSGLRIENDYLLTQSGLEPLSEYPLDMV